MAARSGWPARAHHHMLSPMGRSDYARIEAAIRYLDAHVTEQPSLADVAAHVGLSEFHFQRLFQRWAGISPKRFLQFATAAQARALLSRQVPLLQAAHEVGLSGPGRLHDLIVNVDAVTPGELRRGGAGLTIRYGLHDSPFGRCLVGVTPRGICALSFEHQGGEEELVQVLRARWPAATLERSDAETKALIDRIFSPERRDGPLAVHLRGTNFQLRVWEALLRIPEGAVSTYTQVAEAVGAPSASRAVGNAVGANTVAFLIPCHRVLRRTGAFGGYRWGVMRKRVMLAWEQVHSESASIFQRNDRWPAFPASS